MPLPFCHGQILRKSHFQDQGSQNKFLLGSRASANEDTVKFHTCFLTHGHDVVRLRIYRNRIFHLGQINDIAASIHCPFIRTEVDGVLLVSISSPSINIFPRDFVWHKNACDSTKFRAHIADCKPRVYTQPLTSLAHKFNDSLTSHSIPLELSKYMQYHVLPTDADSRLANEFDLDTLRGLKPRLTQTERQHNIRRSKTNRQTSDSTTRASMAITTHNHHARLSPFSDKLRMHNRIICTLVLCHLEVSLCSFSCIHHSLDARDVHDIGVHHVVTCEPETVVAPDSWIA